VSLCILKIKDNKVYIISCYKIVSDRIVGVFFTASSSSPTESILAWWVLLMKLYEQREQGRSSKGVEIFSSGHSEQIVGPARAISSIVCL